MKTNKDILESYGTIVHDGYSWLVRDNNGGAVNDSYYMAWCSKGADEHILSMLVDVEIVMWKICQ